MVISIAVIGWLTVATQYYLMMENRVEGVLESTVRFFSFFTILTNLLVACYFSMSFGNFKKNDSRLPLGIPLMAVTLYITIVGLVYQIALRHVWAPEGLQWLVDELLHTIIPLAVLIYWWIYGPKKSNTYSELPKWLLYPFLYFIYILIRGQWSGFYPYPFINVTTLGMTKVMINAAIIVGVFGVIGALLIFIKNR